MRLEHLLSALHSCGLLTLLYLLLSIELRDKTSLHIIRALPLACLSGAQLVDSLNSPPQCETDSTQKSIRTFLDIVTLCVCVCVCLRSVSLCFISRKETQSLRAHKCNGRVHKLYFPMDPKYSPMIIA